MTPLFVKWALVSPVYCFLISSAFPFVLLGAQTSCLAFHPLSYVSFLPLVSPNYFCLLLFSPVPDDLAFIFTNSKLCYPSCILEPAWVGRPKEQWTLSLKCLGFNIFQGDSMDGNFPYEVTSKSGRLSWKVKLFIIFSLLAPQHRDTPALKEKKLVKICS